MSSVALKRAALSAIIVVGLSVTAAAQQPGVPQAQSTDAPKAAEQRTGVAPGLPPVTFEEIVKGRPPTAEYSLMAIAAGAVAGVVAVNALLPAFGISAVSAVAAGAPLTAAGLESALAASRIYAIAGAAAGAVTGQLIYWSLKTP